MYDKSLIYASESSYSLFSGFKTLISGITMYNHTTVQLLNSVLTAISYKKNLHNQHLQTQSTNPAYYKLLLSEQW